MQLCEFVCLFYQFYYVHMGSSTVPLSALGVQPTSVQRSYASHCMHTLCTYIALAFVNMAPLLTANKDFLITYTIATFMR